MQLDTGPHVPISVKTLWLLCLRKIPSLEPAPFVLRDFQKQAVSLKGIRTFWVHFISLQLDPAIQPIHLKARRVLFALKLKIDEKLDHLIDQGVFEQVPYRSWEMSIVAPVKPNRSVHICVDY